MGFVDWAEKKAKEKAAQKYAQAKSAAKSALTDMALSALGSLGKLLQDHFDLAACDASLIQVGVHLWKAISAGEDVTDEQLDALVPGLQQCVADPAKFEAAWAAFKAAFRAEHPVELASDDGPGVADLGLDHFAALNSDDAAAIQHAIDVLEGSLPLAQRPPGWQFIMKANKPLTAGEVIVLARALGLYKVRARKLKKAHFYLLARAVLHKQVQQLKERYDAIFGTIDKVAKKKTPAELWPDQCVVGETRVHPTNQALLQHCVPGPSHPQDGHQWAPNYWKSFKSNPNYVDPDTGNGKPDTRSGGQAPTGGWKLVAAIATGTVIVGTVGYMLLRRR